MCSPGADIKVEKFSSSEGRGNFRLEISEKVETIGKIKQYLETCGTRRWLHLGNSGKAQEVAKTRWAALRFTEFQFRFKVQFL